MNNAFVVNLSEEETPDTSRVESLRARDSVLVKLIEAIDSLIKSPDWRILKENEFDGLVDSLESRMKAEALRPEVNLPNLYRLQGECGWAQRFSKLELLRAKYHQELMGIRKITAE